MTQIVKIVAGEGVDLPFYATKGSAGMDLKANNEKPIILEAHGGRALIPTGIFIQLPEGHEAQVRPRSGLALKKGISVLNTPGTIDEDYTGEVGVILVNTSRENFTVVKGERIAQLVIAKYEKITWEKVDSLTTTERGSGGFGHTGNK